MPKKRNWLKKALPRQPTDDSQQDIELSDQDIQALQEYGDSLGFLAHFDASAQYVNKKQPRAEMAPKNDASGDDDIYEEAPRPRQLDTAPTRLPIKTADGRVVQLEAKRARVKQDKPMVVESESDEAEQQVAPLSKDKLVTASIRNEKRKIAAEMNADTCKNMAVIEVKQNLAESALALIEDPEMNIGKLKDLRLFAKDKRPQVIRLLFLTQLAVFKDIIPGYRIRPMTDAERAMQSSKGVRSLRNYEETLLTNYQQYLQSLEDACKSNLKQHGNRQVLETAVYCMAELLGSVSHFNFRANLITALASKIVLRKFPQVTLICSDAFSKLFKYDEQGEATLEAVKVLSEVFQAVKYDMLPIALHPFMCLHLQEASAVYRKKNYGGGNPKKRRKEAPHMSKKIRKINEYRKEVDLEMMEAEATYDKNQVQKFVILSIT